MLFRERRAATPTLHGFRHPLDSGPPTHCSAFHEIHDPAWLARRAGFENTFANSYHHLIGSDATLKRCSARLDFRTLGSSRSTGC
jgi:hypothetical protein